MTNDLPRMMQQLARDHGSMARLLDVLQVALDRYRPAPTLTAADWQKIEAEAADLSNDPLFGGRVDKEYQALRDRILRLAG